VTAGGNDRVPIVTDVQAQLPDEPPQPDRPEPSEPARQAPWWTRRLDILIAVALGLAAIASAFAAYQNEHKNHAATINFNQGITDFDDAGQLLSSANTILTRDQSLFLSYVTALHDGKKELAAYIRTHLMEPRLEAAVAWWESPANTRQRVPADSPFVSGDPKYVIQEKVQAEQRIEQSQQHFAQAKREQEKAAHFQLIEIILAISLFMYGIAGVARAMPVKLTALGSGAAVFVLAVILEITG
jgi:hypothetical protein